MADEKIVEQFLNNAAIVAAQASRVGDKADLNAAVHELIGEGDSIYCPGLTEVEKSLEFPQDRRTDQYETASVCVEEVFAAIAETGSVVSSSHQQKPVQASLLPSHHVALVSSDRIYPTLDDFFGSFGEAPPTNITLITGPSRTADIELTLTIGVHGPERLSVIVF